MIPRPSGSRVVITMSAGDGPLSVYVKDGSRPLTENTHKSAVTVPPNGRKIVTGLPPSVQCDVPTTQIPIAATFKLTFPAAPDPPLVLSSTTTMSFPVAEGAPGVSGIVSGPKPGASTTKVTVFESVPSGFCRSTVRFPAKERSAAVRDVVHCPADVQEVLRAAPATRIVDPGPGLDAMKLAPDSFK